MSADVKTELESLLADLHRELELPEAGRESRAPTPDLLRAKEALMQAAGASERGEPISLPAGIGHMVVDGWSLTSSLSERLVAFAQRYESRS